MTTLILASFGKIWGFPQNLHQLQTIQIFQIQFSSFGSGLKQLIFTNIWKLFSLKFTPLKEIKSTINYLNTCKKIFRRLKMVSYLKGKIILSNVQSYALGWLIVDLINRKHPQNNPI